jgi:hypothetical protein
MLKKAVMALSEHDPKHKGLVTELHFFLHHAVSRYPFQMSCCNSKISWEGPSLKPMLNFIILPESCCDVLQSLCRQMLDMGTDVKMIGQGRIKKSDQLEELLTLGRLR